MTRLLLVDLEPAWRGGQNQALLLLSGLRTRGHAAELLALRGGALAERAAAAGITVHTTGKFLRRALAARRLKQLTAEKSFDVVYVNDAHALTASWLARIHREVPVVVARRVAFSISRSLLSLARYRTATRIVAVSKAVREEMLAARLDGERVEVIPDGVEFAPAVTSHERQQARERWGFAENEHVLAFAGALTSEKGHALLLDAFAVLRQHVPRCRLLLAGEGPLRAQLEQKAQAANLKTSVIFAGFVKDVDAVYAACDLFVFPSLREGLGSSLLSAMSRGLPVVALARGGVEEIIEDGCNGLLIQQAHPLAVATAAAKLLMDAALAQQLGAAARETVADKFSVDLMVERTIRLCGGLTTGSNPGLSESGG